MARMGLCKTCNLQWVSEEAESCPGCGQPEPFETPPPEINSVHDAIISRVDHRYFMYYIVAKAGFYSVQIESEREYRFGDKIRVRILPRGQSGEILGTIC